VALRSTTLLTLADARAWCHGDATESGRDAFVEQAADSASERFERMTSRIFRARNLDEYHDGDYFQPVIYLKRFPVISVTSFTIDGVEVASTAYAVDRPDGRIVLQPGYRLTAGAQNVRVQYRAGYETDAEIPADALECVREMTKRFYRLRTQGGGVFQTVNVGNSSFIVRDELPKDLVAAINQLGDKRFG
jgi:hypothetical protein